MNDESEIRKQIIAIHANTSMTPSEKQTSIMNLMRKSQKDKQENINIEQTSNIELTSNNEHEIIASECTHYERLCLVECPDIKCRKFVKCRLCHDSQISDHKLDRFSISNVMCMNCNEIQSVSNKCIKCETLFGKYYCNICHLFENNEGKDIFHCQDCGICRMGKAENFTHCPNCNLCINNELYNNHKCFLNTWNDCPVCMDELKNSVKQLFLLKCGHGIHVECLRVLLSNDYRCPLCKKSIGDMSHAWDRMSQDLKEMRGNAQIDLITSTGENMKKNCICNDCGKSFEVNRNVFNMYSCPDCKSFNSSS